MLIEQDTDKLLDILKSRFEKNMGRHMNMAWKDVQQKLLNNSSKLSALYEMESTGGEPDVVLLEGQHHDVIYYDCSVESPKLRRGLCYDREALENRKDHPPKNNVISMSEEMGVTLLTEHEYRALQEKFKFDLKSSSWVLTPSAIRNNGGAIFCDCRYGRVFTYHNSAQSYYASRGFRCKLIL